MKKEMICIACPRGCRLTAENNGGGWVIEGNNCPKGRDYGIQEAECPLRTLTTTVRTNSRFQPRLSVRTDGDIHLAAIPGCMKAVSGIVAVPPLKPGDIVCKDIAGTGRNLISTGELEDE